MPLFQNATFHISAHHLSDLPGEVGVEVAFAGRSNAGKSSALNTLANHNRLAYVSKQPGRTQLINQHHSHLGQCVWQAGQGLEGDGTQGVAGQNCHGLPEHNVVGGTAAAQVVVVHGRQVVVDQRIGMDHLERAGGVFAARNARPHHPRRRHRQQGPNPFAAREDAVANCFVNRFWLRRFGRQPTVQSPVHQHLFGGQVIF